MTFYICFSKFNFKTGADEVYLFNGKTAAPVLLADGIDAEFDGSDYGVYAVDTDDVVTIYAADGTALLVVKYGFNDIELNDFAVIETKFEGKSINYILK